MAKPLLRLNKGQFQFSLNGGANWATADSLGFRELPESTTWYLRHAGTNKVTHIGNLTSANNAVSLKSMMMIDALYQPARYPVTIGVSSYGGDYTVLTKHSPTAKGWEVPKGSMTATQRMPNYRAELEF